MEKSIQRTLNLLLDKVCGALDSKSEVEIIKEADQYRINIKTKNESIFKDERGGLLKSIEHYLRIVVHKQFPDDRTHFIIDVNSARFNREHKLKQQIPELTKKIVLEEGKVLVLIGLNGYERLIVHQLLANSRGLETNSIGPDNNRKLLIMPTSETGSTGMDDSVVWDIEKN